MELPEGLRLFDFHGLELSYREGNDEAGCECPFCGKRKFSVNVDTTLWKCQRCSAGGNNYKFLKMVWESSSKLITDYTELSMERMIKEETLKEWGVVRSIITGDWLIPGYNVDGEINQLYKYVRFSDGKRRLLATPTIGHKIHGINLYNKNKKVVYLCEGPWDAMKLWETMKNFREYNGKFIKTKSSDNLLVGANVLAVPGCSTFYDSWSSVFTNKKVYIVFDNDHPTKQPKTGKMLEPAGLSGVKRVSGKLGKKPNELLYMKWGDDGYNEQLPSGMDVRDFINNGGSIGDLFSKMKNVPKEWINGKLGNGKDLQLTNCDKWMRLSNQWRRALSWSYGLDVSLSVMLASIVSTDVVGDQLWVKIIGPASTAKSTLCEAISTNRKYVIAKSTIRGFYSGFKSEGGEDEDNSLIKRASGKTLVTKDGDTLLQSPNLGQILSEARDIYDKTGRTHYRNKMSKEYTNVNMTWILCGTSSLRSIDNSELGERFLDCVIMENIDDDEEDRILLSVVKREDRNISSGDDGGNKELNDAMSITGGYINYLRDNAKSLLFDVETPEEYQILITRVGKFVAYMRARPSISQTEKAEREFGTRLTSQLIRLAKCLAVVLNKNVVDREVMKRTIKVAMDTSRGITLDICRILYDEEFQIDGAEAKTLSLMTNQPESKTRELLRFLKAIHAVEQFQKKSAGLRSRKKWRLTRRINLLFDDVLEWE